MYGFLLFIVDNRGVGVIVWPDLYIMIYSRWLIEDRIVLKQKDSNISFEFGVEWVVAIYYHTVIIKVHCYKFSICNKNSVSKSQQAELNMQNLAAGLGERNSTSGTRRAELGERNSASGTRPTEFAASRTRQAELKTRLLELGKQKSISRPRHPELAIQNSPSRKRHPEFAIQNSPSRI